MNFETIYLLLVCLFPVAFIIVIARKIFYGEEINLLDLLLTIYTVIWLFILTTIGIYSIEYYTYIKQALGIREEYLWIATILAIILLIYIILSWRNVSKTRKRELYKSYKW